MMYEHAVDAVLANTRIARDAAEATAEYLHALPADAWNGPTACSAWSVRELATHLGHGNALWAATIHEVFGVAPQEGLTLLDHTAMPPDVLADAISSSMSDFVDAMELLDVAQACPMIDTRIGAVPLTGVAALAMIENVIHNWDLRVKRHPNVAIPCEWAVPVARATEGMLQHLTRSAAAQRPGTYRVCVDESLGDVTVVARDGHVHLQRRPMVVPDLSVRLTADQYVRLLWGRLDPSALMSGHHLQAKGAHQRVTDLTRIFSGL